MSGSATLNGQRLLALRELEGLTQTELARSLGVSQPSLSKMEKAARPLTQELVERAEARFHLPRSFFEVPPSLLDVSVPTFRKSSAAKATDERRIVRKYREAARVFAAASEASGYIESKLPANLGHNDDVEAVAHHVRNLAGLSAEAAVTNVTRLVEKLGFGVVSHLDHADQDDEESTHSGISIPSTHSTRPLIALPAPLPGAVMRFTLAHELAHHIWDSGSIQRNISTRSPQERRAHDFAGALLLPRTVIANRVTESLHLTGYLPIKADFGVSVGAIIMRAKRLGVIGKDRARSLQIQLSARGWRRAEPVEVTVERPLLLGQAIDRSTTFTISGIERFSALPAALVCQWLERAVPEQDPVVDLQRWRRNRESSSYASERG